MGGRPYYYGIYSTGRRVSRKETIFRGRFMIMTGYIKGQDKGIE